MRTLLTSALMLLPFAAESTVELRRADETVTANIDGEEFAVYHFASSLPKPYFWPVRGPGGTILTRQVATPDVDRKQFDHPHHRGLWIAVDEVNDTKFWAESGKIETSHVELIHASGNPAQMQVTNRWVDANGELAVTETTKISIYANRLLIYDINFTAGDRPVSFADTKEGLFGFRMVDSMRERQGGHVVNSDGLEGSAACWGKTANWVDYYGTVDSKTFGVALFDHPSNFRPSRYHVRDYGLFSMSPFGPHAYTNGKLPEQPVVVRPGKTIGLRYAIYIHAGDTKQGDVAGAYAQFLKASN